MATIVQGFTTVWGALLDFISSSWTSLIDLFYTNNELTFVGILAIVMSGISIILLAFNLIRSFFAMRG